MLPLGHWVWNGLIQHWIVHIDMYQRWILVIQSSVIDLILIFIILIKSGFYWPDPGLMIRSDCTIMILTIQSWFCSSTSIQILYLLPTTAMTTTISCCVIFVLNHNFDYKVSSWTTQLCNFVITAPMTSDQIALHSAYLPLYNSVHF